MAFEGDLSNLQLGDIFQTLAMTRQTGTFVVRGSEERRIAFSERGIALLSERQSLGRWVGNYLVGAGAIERTELEDAQETLRRRREGYLPDILVEQGNCAEASLRSAMRYVAAEEIYELFAWRDGRFEFLAGEEELTGPFADLWFDVGSIAMEAARRLDESAQFLGHIRDEDIHVRVDMARDTLPPEDHGKHATLVYSLLDGSRTVTRLQDDAALGRFDVTKSLATLLEAQLIRVASAGEIREAAIQALAGQDSKRAATLFEAACKLDPENQELRQEVADTLTKCGQKRDAAVHLVELGNLLLRSGGSDGAEDALKRAIRLDNGCSAAHAGLMQVHLSKGDVGKAIDAARQAASRWIAAEEYDLAIEIAKSALDHQPGDVSLRMSLANAQLGAGNDEAAVASLDELVGILETSGAPDTKLLEAYRTIVKLDPERRDSQRRIEEIHARGRARRRRVMHVAVGSVMLVMLAMFSVPMFIGPGVDEQITLAWELHGDKDTAAAREILFGLMERSDLNGAQRKRLTSLEEVLKAPANAPHIPQSRIETAQAQLASVYSDAALLVENDDQFVQALQMLLETAHALEEGIWKEIKQARPDVHTKEVGDAKRESQIQLDLVMLRLEKIASEVDAIRESFSGDVLVKTDPVVMQTLVQATEKSQHYERLQAWDTLPRLVKALMEATQLKDDGTTERVTQVVARLAEAFKIVNVSGAHALSEVRRYNLKNNFHSSRSIGNTLIGEGRFEDAIREYQSFLEQCAELAAAEPVELYAPIEQQLLDPPLDMDGRIETRLVTLRRIIAGEEQAQRALDRGDIEQAYELRANLVRENREVDFSTRFRLPVRIETRPPGAKVFLLDTSTGAMYVSDTPCIQEIAIQSRTRLALRLEGFKEQVIERKGAFDAGTGREIVDLVKTELWRSQPGSITEASPAVSGDRVFLADRNGIVRAISVKDGTEIDKHDTNLVSGITSAVAVTGGRIYVSTLDSYAFVFDELTLAPIRKYKLAGPGRGAPLPFDGDAILADEGGMVRRVGPEGEERWIVSVGAKVRTDPVRHGSRVLVTTVEGDLVSLDATAGASVGRVRLGDAPLWCSPIVQGRRAYVASDNGEIVCVDLVRGQILWREPLDEAVPARPTISQGKLIVGTHSGSVFGLDLETGQRLTRAIIGGSVRADLLSTPEGYVVVTESGLLTHFAHDGQPRWVFDAKEEVRAAPRMHDGKLLVATKNGTAILLTR